MNKYFLLIGIGVLLIGGGIVYRVFFISESSKPVTSGKTVEITIVAKKNEWRFDPEVIEVNRGDKVVIHAVNEDEYDHGIGIDAFGISQRMPAKETITFDFVVTQEGDFSFYCSVPCGEGEVEGTKRTHFDMIGNLHVRSVANSI